MEAAAAGDRGNLESSGLQVRQTDRGWVLIAEERSAVRQRSDLKTGAERALDTLAEFLQQSRPLDRDRGLHRQHRPGGCAESLLGSAEPGGEGRAGQARYGTNRIDARGYGPKFPIASNDTASAGSGTGGWRCDDPVANSGADPESPGRPQPARIPSLLRAARGGRRCRPACARPCRRLKSSRLLKVSRPTPTITSPGRSGCARSPRVPPPAHSRRRARGAAARAARSPPGRGGSACRDLSAAGFAALLSATSSAAVNFTSSALPSRQMRKVALWPRAWSRPPGAAACSGRRAPGR